MTLLDPGMDTWNRIMQHARDSSLPLQQEIDAMCSRQATTLRAAQDNARRAQQELAQADHQLAMLDRAGPIQGIDAFAAEKRDLIGRVDALRIKRDRAAQLVTQVEQELASARQNARAALMQRTDQEMQIAGQQAQAEVDRAMAEVRRISEANRKKLEALADRLRSLQSLPL